MARDKADDEDSLTGRKAPSNFVVSLVGSTLYHLLSGRWKKPYFRQEIFDKARDNVDDDSRCLCHLRLELKFIASRRAR